MIDAVEGLNQGKKLLDILVDHTDFPKTLRSDTKILQGAALEPKKDGKREETSIYF
jgi:hypothetical protein